MKINRYICSVIIFASSFVSCEDYLDKVQEFEGLNQEDVFEDILLARDFLDGGYGYLLTEMSARGGNNKQSDYLPGMTMSGEGYPGRVNSSVPELYNFYAQGDYLSLMNRGFTATQSPNFVERYSFSWKGIRIVNSFLENADRINNASEEDVNNLKGQAYFLRAYYYHLMTKRHGGLYYLKENLNLNESLDKNRESYASNLADMLEDLDLAIDLLPIDWSSENVGRPTKGAAMALKSRVTLFGASPLANTTNDVQAWQDAAIAASDLIQFANTNGLYNLADASAASGLDVGHDGADLFLAEPEELAPYRNIFVGPGIQKTIPDEVIFMEVNEIVENVFKNTINPIPRLTLTSGFDTMKGNGRPMNIGALANFVDKFETKSGLAIEDDTSYNPQEPFINRDPRFYNAILFDGVAWDVTTAGPLNKTGFVDLAVVNEEYEYGIDLHNPKTPANLTWRVQNLTGYRIRKWVSHGFGWPGYRNFHINNNVFRMGEVYLNYAEAVNEAYGPNGTAPGFNLTALEAVNMIRNRVGMPNVNSMYIGSKEAFRERIRNERAVELCFEGIRYDDLRRWKVAHLEENLKVEFLEMRWQGGTSVLYPTGFSYDKVEQTNLKKTFNEKNYWWPIPSSEIEAVPTFGQTIGW
ncbi:RagB/SusD family nutrient uptake outer membrane protein [Algibacter pacificus]|uniref:RagB/SusD family nutrient uptake outer membrane protein n=1 Tax=Algibacter pacificus TaxID=2599389 RepID=UPI00164F5ADD|nr:RagB/SusD family nutrient uptake outer membrane protein [Algibacter pacificus]